MENAAPQQAVPDSKPPGRWARPGNKIRRMARNIFIGAILAACVNFFLLKTGWHTWEIFTEKADQFAEDQARLKKTQSFQPLEEHYSRPE